MFPSDRFYRVSSHVEIFILSHQTLLFFVFFLQPGNRMSRPSDYAP